MKEFWNTIQLVFAAVGGWLGYFLGGCDGLLIALVIFVVCDYLTGIMCAIADKKLSSEVGFINTGSMESELFLAILSSMAEGESVSISENSKWSI